MKIRFYLFLCASALLLIVSCGKNQDAQTSAAPKANNNVGPEGATNLNYSIEQGALYVSSCIKEKQSIAGIQFPSKIVTYSEADFKFVKTKYLFTTDDCKYESVKIIEAGVVNTDDRVSENKKSSEPAVLVRNFEYQQNTVIVTNSLVAASFTRNQICGQENWDADVEKILTEMEIAENCFIKKLPRTETDRFLLSKDSVQFVMESLKEIKFNKKR